MGMGGAQQQVLNLIKSPALREYRHSIVCAIAKQGEFLQPAVDAGIAVHECPIRWFPPNLLPSYRLNRFLRHRSQFTFSWRLARLLRAIDAHLVHSQLTASMYWQANAVLRKANLPWVWTLHGLYKTRGEDVTQWEPALKLIAASDIAAVTGVSTAVLDEVAQYQMIAPEKLHVIYNGVETARFVSSPELRNIWRKHWKFPDDAFVFGSAGRLIPVKRFDVALSAFAEVAREHPDVHFALAGDGELAGALRAQATQLEIADRVHFLGFQTDTNNFFNALDAFVLSSDSEGLANVILEAMICGLPCIATAVGGNPEILENIGLLVPAGSSRLLAQAMRKFLVPEQRAFFAQASAAAAHRFDMVATASQYRVLYDQLLYQHRMQ